MYLDVKVEQAFRGEFARDKLKRDAGRWRSSE